MTAPDPALAALQAAWPTDDHHVDTWHPDDQRLYRDYRQWDSFPDRAQLILTQRQQRVLSAVRTAVLTDFIEWIAAGDHHYELVKWWDSHSRDFNSVPTEQILSEYLQAQEATS